MRSSGARIAVAAIVGLLALSASDARAAALQRTVRVDLTASAHPHTATTLNLDRAFHVDSVYWSRTRGATTATASATCDGCAAQAVSVQVLYLSWSPGATIDNVAIAWAQGCTSCGATAVSVQVDVVEGWLPVTVSNRALALNASCLGCRTASAAYQLVVAGNGRSHLSGQALRSLQQWASDRARVLSEPSTASPQRSGTGQRDLLDPLAALVNTDLGSRTVAAHARVVAR